MIASLQQIPSGDAVLLHAVAQNPTGVDPTPDQWTEIVRVIAGLGLIPVLDNAYQGYASGSLEQDGFAQRLFEESGLEYFVAQSFAKNLPLRRAHRLHTRALRLPGDLHRSALAVEDPHSPGVLQPSQARCRHRVPGAL